MRLPPLLAIPLLLTAGCGAEADRLGSGAAREQTQVHEGAGVVLESPEHGPELCLGGVEESYPPQCGGVPLVGWDWAAVEGEESANGTTWGSYRVVGTYDGEQVVVREAVPAEPGAPAQREDPFATPCPEPAAGWQVADPDRIDAAALDRAIALARSQPEHAGVWIDHLTEASGPTERHDGRAIVLNAAFTDGLAEQEQQLRAVWGGALCVVERPRTLAELRGMQDELVTGGVADELGLAPTYASVDEMRGVVELGVVAASDEQRDALTERYGEGVVELHPALVSRADEAGSER